MAKIRDLLAKGRTFSFEFFPPKTDEGHENLRKAIGELEALKPSFVSVTYGAGGSTREKTRDVVIEIKETTSLEAMPHLTCIAHTRADIEGIVGDYRAQGFDNLLALHGDPPRDNPDLETGDIPRAAGLVEIIRSVEDFSIGVAAHPEGHPKAPDPVTDRKHQAAKLKVADFGITQFFFRSEDYFRLLDDLDKLGVRTPIIAGVIPVTNAQQTQRFAELSGAAFPPELAERFERVADDPDEVRRVGVEVASEICQDLLDGGAPGIHFYTLNRAQATREVYENLGIPVG